MTTEVQRALLRARARERCEWGRLERWRQQGCRKANKPTGRGYFALMGFVILVELLVLALS